MMTTHPATERSRQAASTEAGAVPWHATTADVCLAKLGSNAGGLSELEATRRLAADGPNRLPSEHRRGLVVLLLGQLRSLLIYVLLGAAALTAVIGHWTDCTVILAVVVVNAVIGAFQEGRADRAFAAIRRLLALQVTIARDSQRRSLPAENLVVGDVVVLVPGDRLAADLRLIEVKGLETQEAALTGESTPVAKSVEAVSAAAPVAERASIAYAGTLVTRGHGRGVVVATGVRTEAGRIGVLLTTIEPVATPLTRSLDRLGRWLTAAVLLLAGIVFLVGVAWRGTAPIEMMLAAVGLGVAAVPEGLPAIVSIVLAIGVQRMARRNAIVRRLGAIETLGAVTVICTDKTGTLTRNEMVVEYLVTAAGALTIDADMHALPPAATELLRAAILCSDAETRAGSFEGDPTEVAMGLLASRLGLARIVEERQYPRVDSVPFESERRFMATLHRTPEGHRLIVKGAPERVLAFCEPLAREDRLRWETALRELANQGYRVLAVAERAHRASTIDPNAVGDGFTALGLVGMTDPPREEARAAVAHCREAGIAVKMITGDHAGTARAVAMRLGFGSDPKVVTGAALDRMSAAELVTTARETSVFARTGPEHKLRLIEALQADGAVVAMTGDGVNDAPALKRADVGIAMGKGGTEAAKEAAQLVLADDDFATIARAVEDGRAIHENLKRTVLYLLPTNGGEAAAIVVAVLCGITLPISPLQILWVNLATEVTLTLAFAFEPVMSGLMQRPPRGRNEPLLGARLLWRIGYVSLIMVAACFGMFEWMRAGGASLEAARTAAVNAIVAVEIAYLFNIRCPDDGRLTRRQFFGNPVALGAVALVVLLQLGFTYLPLLQEAFATEALLAPVWLAVLAIGAGSFGLIEIETALLERGRRWLAADRP